MQIAAGQLFLVEANQHAFAHGLAQKVLMFGCTAVQNADAVGLAQLDAFRQPLTHMPIGGQIPHYGGRRSGYSSGVLYVRRGHGAELRSRSLGKAALI